MRTIGMFGCGIIFGLIVMGGLVSARNYVPPYRGTFDFGMISVTQNFRWKAPRGCTPMAWRGPWTDAIEAQYRTHISFNERCILEAARRDAEAASNQIIAEGELERSKLVAEYEEMIARERRR
jgi:hypothetical protein